MNLVEQSSRARRVLIVEDHEDTRVLMSRLLSRRGYETETVGTVAEAVAACAAGMPDVVVSDLDLPDGSGLDLVRELRSRGGGVRCIALTGHGQREQVEATRRAGFDAHLTKPVSFDRLESALCGDGANRAEN